MLGARACTVRHQMKCTHQMKGTHTHQMKCTNTHQIKCAHNRSLKTPLSVTAPFLSNIASYDKSISSLLAVLIAEFEGKAASFKPVKTSFISSSTSTYCGADTPYPEVEVSGTLYYDDQDQQYLSSCRY